MSRLRLCVALPLLWAAEAAAQDAPAAPPPPAICPTAPSTVAVDFGAYHGSVWVTDAAGKPPFDGTTRFDCPAKRVTRAWEGCGFSVCNLPDGTYGFRFSRIPPEARLQFSLSGGKIHLEPTRLAVQAGNYGIDATGSRVDVAFDLRGYDGPWAVEAWPGDAFHGTGTGGRGTADNGVVTLSLYPQTPYAIRVGDRTAAVITAGTDGSVQAAPAPGAKGQPFRIKNGKLELRVARVMVSPASVGASWHVESQNATQGEQNVLVAADSAVRLFEETHASAEVLSVDDQCRAVLSGPAGGHMFRVTKITCD
jgi:hypothetical protein